MNPEAPAEAISATWRFALRQEPGAVRDSKWRCVKDELMGQMMLVIYLGLDETEMADNIRFLIDLARTHLYDCAHF